jgi:hypothetical protein
VRLAVSIVCGCIGIAIAVSGQRDDGVFLLPPDHPAIQYTALATSDPISDLNRNLQDGKVHLKFDGAQGYLPSVLEALNIPIESQMMVFSKTSVQSDLIRPDQPRTLFFNDSVIVGFVHGGFIEVAAQDPKQGAIFYTLDQSVEDKPVFIRRNECLRCHVSYATSGIAGMLVRSVVTASDGEAQQQFGQYVSDQRSPFEERWGGWYVTGKNISMRHMGNTMITMLQTSGPIVTNKPVTRESLKGRLDTAAYLSPYSDIVALMVFEHQMHMMNLLTRIGWEARYAEYSEHVRGPMFSESPTQAPSIPNLTDTARELVDYLLFVDEAALPTRVQGTSGFTERFSARGPSDRKGRSLRQFDLERRLMRYPCSYMIYSPAFDALPDAARMAIFQRMWQILSGRESKDARYARLSLADRQAVVEILRETKKDLPSYFQGTIR